MDAPRLTRYPTTDGKEGWAKEIGDMVMPASSDEVALWKENERLRAALLAARPHVAGSIDYPEHTRDEVLAQIDAALGYERSPELREVRPGLYERDLPPGEHAP